MPGHEARIMRFLDEEAGIPAQDVRAQQVLDGVQNLGMPDHVVDPGEEHMAAMAHLALDRASARGFIILEPAAKIGHFARAQRVDREVIAAVAIGSDVIFAQQLWHGVPPILLFFVITRASKNLAKGDPTVSPCQEALKRTRSSRPTTDVCANYKARNRESYCDAA